MRVGVLALQGDFREHCFMLKKIGINPLEVRSSEDLAKVNALIIPGGESTTIGKLMKKYGLDKEIREKCNQGMPIYGTCAGAIVLSKEVMESKQPKLNLIDISVRRNSYGRQIDSFESDLKISGMRKPYRGIFIRAPHITQIRDGVKVLAEHDDSPVLVKTDNILLSTFHPELTDDTRIHKYFLNMIKSS